MAHSGPSRACASFAPTMSVRVFGHFEQFSIFSARRAPCSAPSCTPDSWTNGPYMTWVLWTLVPMVQAPRRQSGATFVRLLAQSECGQFCHFGICGPNWDCHHGKWHGDLWEPRAWEPPLDSWWMVYGMADPISKPALRYTIGSTREFWLISSSQNDPLLGPQFHPPPCGQLAAPYLYAHEETWTQFQVVHSDIGHRFDLLSRVPLALPWPGEPRVRMMPIVVILAS